MVQYILNSGIALKIAEIVDQVKQYQEHSESYNGSKVSLAANKTSLHYRRKSSKGVKFAV